MIPFATETVAGATLEGVECPYTPDAVGGVLVTRSTSLLFTDVNAAQTARRRPVLAS
jgi:hypothetical protein